MRQHKLALCADDFLTWFIKQTMYTIKRDKLFAPDAKLLVAVSGGKDSLALWDVLNRLDFHCDGIYVGLGINGELNYSARSREFAQRFADRRDLKLIVVDVESTYGATIPQASKLSARGAGKPCSLCGLTRRYIMNRTALEGNYDVLVTGHNLDDEAATLMGNTMNWLVGYLRSQSPLLPEKQGFVRKAKPLHRFYERETAAYAFLRGIEYVQEECPFSVDAKSIYYKNLLNQIETDRPGAKQGFYLSFLQAKDQMKFNPELEQPNSLDRLCVTCGQPTRGGERCAFCSTWDKIRLRVADQYKNSGA
ncbi:MAG: ATP-binding protein [Anaerolineales bacterium]